MTGKNRLPRLDLHCHLDGSLSQGCIEELLGRSVKLEEGLEERYSHRN